jgi:hypothetical protein
MMGDFGWPVSATELTLVNKVLSDYGITDMRSIRLFFATCAHESRFGANALELLNLDGTVAGVGYGVNDRGAGYIQLTGRDLHLLFLDSDKIKDRFIDTNTAQHIATNYPWQAAAWYWSSREAKTIVGHSINDYVVRHGDSLGVYLITQHYVGGVNLGIPQEQAVGIRDGTLNNWDVKAVKKIINGREVWVDRLFINGVETQNAPQGWTTPGTGRQATYDKAVKCFIGGQ